MNFVYNKNQLVSVLMIYVHLLYIYITNIALKTDFQSNSLLNRMHIVLKTDFQSNSLFSRMQSSKKILKYICMQCKLGGYIKGVFSKF